MYSAEITIEDHDASAEPLETDGVQMNQVRDMVRPCMPKNKRFGFVARCAKNVHYSWLDVQRGLDASGKDTAGERIFQYSHSDAAHRRTDWLGHDAELREQLQTEDDVRFFLLGGERSGTLAQAQVHPSLQLQMQCAKARVHLPLIHDTFQEVLQDEQATTLQRQAYLAQRFAMDAYTVCRLFRRATDARTRPRENYLIYEGFWHLRNQVRMLKRLGFRAWEGPAPWLSSLHKESTR